MPITVACAPRIMKKFRDLFIQNGLLTSVFCDNLIFITFYLYSKSKKYHKLFSYLMYSIIFTKTSAFANKVFVSYIERFSAGENNRALKQFSMKSRSDMVFTLMV